MLLYWIWFSCLPKLNTGLKCRLLEHFHSPEDIYHAEPKAFSTLAEVEPASLEALDNKDLTQAKQILQTCTEKDIRILTYSDSAYPIQLRNIPHPPVLLYYKGTLPNFEAQPVIAVVGTRKATSYGMNASRRLSGQIAACGGLVITGGASGIDTMAIHGAMDAEAMPVAVLGNGVDVVYPSANRQLFRQIETQGCLLSEYPPGTPAHSWHFPQRNRILSGISHGVLVVEAPERSGALITARNASQQRRDVFVVPGNIDVDACVGSNALLRENAIAAFCGYDVVKEYELQFPGKIRRAEPGNITAFSEKAPAKVAQTSTLPEKTRTLSPIPDKLGIDNRDNSPYSVLRKQLPALSPQEQEILGLLSPQPKPVDEILSATDIPSGRVLSILTMLQIAGLAENHPGRMVSLK